MITKRKIKKLQHLINSKFQENNFRNLTASNETLSKVIKTILQLKNSEFDAEDEKVFYELKEYRKSLLNNNDKVTYEIFGSDKTDSVSNICSKATSPEIWCKLHYLLAKNLNAKNYLEIGTNLGVSGSYILSAIKNNNRKFVTMEGLPKLCEIAENQFKNIAGENKFQILQGLYENTFPEMLRLPLHFDIMFLDGNHKFEPTMDYFRKLKNKIGDTAVFVFDDIYLSNEMMRVWKEILNDRDVNYTVDLYKLGIVIIDKNDSAKNVNTQYFLSR